MAPGAWLVRKVEVTGEFELFAADFELFASFHRLFRTDVAGFVQKIRRSCDNLTGVHTHKIYLKNPVQNGMPKK